MTNPPDNPPPPASPEERYYIPAGMPPGHDPMVQQDGTPEGVYYFRIYGALMCLIALAVIVSGMGVMLNPLLSAPPGPMPPSAVSTVVGGIVYTGMGLAALIPFLIALFGGRRRWIHTLALILVALSMMTTCCLPIGIPLLIVWQKPETKNWFNVG